MKEIIQQGEYSLNDEGVYHKYARNAIPGTFPRKYTDVRIVADDDERLNIVIDPENEALRADCWINQYGYPSINYMGKDRPLHAVVYYLKTGTWSKMNVTGIHHKNHNKLDARFSNLEMVGWNEHRKEHSAKHFNSVEPKFLKKGRTA